MIKVLLYFYNGLVKNITACWISKNYSGNYLTDKALSPGSHNTVSVNHTVFIGFAFPIYYDSGKLAVELLKRKNSTVLNLQNLYVACIKRGQL